VINIVNNSEQNLLLSIVIPTFNGQEYIETCIKSILANKSREIEIIVIDDCSTDATFKIVNNFHDDRLKSYKNNSRLGMQANYEKALELTKGKWISYIGQDDLMRSDTIDKFINLTNKYPNIDLIVSSRSYFFWSNYRRNFFIPKLIIFKNNYFTRIKSSSKRLRYNLLGIVDYKEGPQLYTGTIVRRCLIDKIKRIQNGRFFVYPIPDVSSAVSLLSNSKNYLKTFDSLFLVGTSSGSTGIKINQLKYRDRSLIIEQFNSNSSIDTPGLGLTSSSHWYFMEAFMQILNKIEKRDDSYSVKFKYLQLAMTLATKDLLFRSENFKQLLRALIPKYNFINIFIIILLTFILFIKIISGRILKFTYSIFLFLFGKLVVNYQISDENIQKVL
jgi:glycosyltransferase involved in cell wall biosynthesis